MTARDENHRVCEKLDTFETLQVAFGRVDTSVKLAPEISNGLFLQFCDLDLLVNGIDSSKLLINEVNLALVELHLLGDIVNLLVSCTNYFHLLTQGFLQLFNLSAVLS